MEIVSVATKIHKTSEKEGIKKADFDELAVFNDELPLS